VKTIYATSIIIPKYSKPSRSLFCSSWEIFPDKPSLSSSKSSSVVPHIPSFVAENRPSEVAYLFQSALFSRKVTSSRIHSGKENTVFRSMEELGGRLRAELSIGFSQTICSFRIQKILGDRYPTASEGEEEKEVKFGNEGVRKLGVEKMKGPQGLSKK
jgi:hypothetical protein